MVVLPFVFCSNGFITNDYRLMASSLVKMGAADGEVDVNAFAFDIEKVIDSLSSVEAQLDTSAVIDEDTGRVSYGTSVNFDQEVRWRELPNTKCTSRFWCSAADSARRLKSVCFRGGGAMGSDGVNCANEFRFVFKPPSNCH